MWAELLDKATLAYATSFVAPSLRRLNRLERLWETEMRISFRLTLHSFDQ